MNKIKTLSLINLFLFLSSPLSAEPQQRQIESLVFTCYTCHGTDGESPGAIPSLKGETASKIKEKLLAFQQDHDEPTIMNRIAKGYSEDEINRIAEYLAAIK